MLAQAAIALESEPVKLRELRAGPLRVHWDFILVVLGTGLVSGLVRQDPVAGATMGSALALSIALHELGHGLAARALGRPMQVVLQLTGGLTYLGPKDTRGQQALVLLAGPLAGGVGFALGRLLEASFAGQLLGYFGTLLSSMSVLWAVFQVLPFPPLDGGLLLRRVGLAGLASATLAWRLGWILGFTVSLLLVAMEPRLLEPAVWLVGMVVILGRAEAGHVRHLDAFEAWQRGDHAEVIRRVRRAPDYLDPRDRRALLELGVSAGIEQEDFSAVEDLAAKLPAAHPSCVRAAEWLMMRGRAFGARLAEQAFDAWDADRLEGPVDRDRWADLAMRLAIYEADSLKLDSALGLLERAAALGFDNVDRLEAEGAFHQLRENPRWATILSVMRSAV